MILFRIHYGNKPDETRLFENYREAIDYAAFNAKGWGYSIERAITEDNAYEYGIYAVDGGYKVKVYDRYGGVWLCDYSKEKHTWHDCIFPTLDEAFEARERYYGRM